MQIQEGPTQAEKLGREELRGRKQRQLGEEDREGQQRVLETEEMVVQQTTLSFHSRLLTKTESRQNHV